MREPSAEPGAGGSSWGASFRQQESGEQPSNTAPEGVSPWGFEGRLLANTAALSLQPGQQPGFDVHPGVSNQQVLTRMDRQVRANIYILRLFNME